MTVWNDDGETLFAPNRWSIVYGAANAWEKEATKVSDFDGKFDWVFYGNTDHRFVQTLKRLSSINELLHRQGINLARISEGRTTAFSGAIHFPRTGRPMR